MAEEQRHITKDPNHKPMQRLTAYISGTVQRTAYRAQVMILANAFGLSGYVQNLPDGRVKVVAEGDESDLERFVKALKIRDTFIDVESIDKEYSPATGDFVGFSKMVFSGETDQRLDRAAYLLKELIDVNKDVVKEIRLNREEFKGVRDDLRGVREELKGAREDICGIGDGIRDVCEGIGGIREEIKGAREDIRGVCGEVRSTGKTLAGKIDCARVEIVGEIRGLRSEMRDDLKGRLIRMEVDVSQIKAKIGL